MNLHFKTIAAALIGFCFVSTLYAMDDEPYDDEGPSTFVAAQELPFQTFRVKDRESLDDITFMNAFHAFSHKKYGRAITIIRDMISGDEDVVPYLYDAYTLRCACHIARIQDIDLEPSEEMEEVQQAQLTLTLMMQIEVDEVEKQLIPYAMYWLQAEVGDLLIDNPNLRDLWKAYHPENTLDVVMLWRTYTPVVYDEPLRIVDDRLRFRIYDRLKNNTRFDFTSPTSMDFARMMSILRPNIDQITFQQHVELAFSSPTFVPRIEDKVVRLIMLHYRDKYMKRQRLVVDLLSDPDFSIDMVASKHKSLREFLEYTSQRLLQP